MKKKQLILGLLVLAALVALWFWGRDKIHFDFGVFRAQLALADWRTIAIGLACIYFAYVLRAVRWALLMKHTKRVPLFSLLGTQVIGFTAVALIGRVADLVRPYLVAKRTALPLSTQIAVYIVERLFDAGSMALIFSSVILLSPAGSLPHPEIVKKAGYWGLALTVCGAIFLVIVRLAGPLVASFFEHAFGMISKKLGQAAGDRIRTFHAGLDTMRSFSDFGAVTGLSLGMWLVISLAYLEVMRAFVASPQLGSMTLGKAMLMLATSGVASVVQLPIIGWFTQIGIVAAAMANFYGASPEASTACAATVLLVTFLGIAPIGLIWAQFEHVSLRKITSESEHAGDELAEENPSEGQR
ncbi:MAG: lysylphosphatidylglycerol synthase transmembrane domain-containing protein [Terracidiphilus sp.]